MKLPSWPLFFAALLAACSSERSPSAPGAPAPVADGGTPDAAPTFVADPVGFGASGALREARALATATRLPDGRVLVVGGENDDYAMLATAEIYDPVTEKVTAAAPLPEPRAHHTATLLSSGEVLIVGGGQGSEISIPTGDGVLASAVIYDPAKNAWRATGAMKGARAGHRAASLADGRVLVVGGGDRVGYPCAAIHPNCMIATSIGTAEIYDPGSGTFSPTGDLAQPRLAFTLDALPDGRVVATAGAAANQGLTSVELFDAKAGRWSKGPALDGQRLYHGSAVLGGALVIIGGKIVNVGPLTTTDVLDVDKSTWRRAASVNIPRTGAKLVPLTSGRGLLIGGNNQLANESLADARIYDAQADTWTAIAPLKRGRYSHSVVMLDDGSAVVIGGRDDVGTIATIERTRTP